MSNKKEQVKPFAPPAYRLDIDESNALPTEFMGRGHQRCIKWGGCCFAILSIVVVVLLVLMLTVFHIKDPILNVNYANIRGLNSVADSDQGLNLTIEANMSVKNLNVASFKFSNMTIYVYYDGSVIGQTKTLSGKARARRSLRMSLMIELRGLKGDSSMVMLPISSYVWISGEVRISSGIKRMLVVRMNCTMNVNLSSQIIQDQNCRRVS